MQNSISTKRKTIFFLVVKNKLKSSNQENMKEDLYAFGLLTKKILQKKAVFENKKFYKIKYFAFEKK